MRIIVFDLQGLIAYYKKYWSNATPISYHLPPPTAIFGLLGAILGYKKEEYNQILADNHVKVTVGLKSKVRKLRSGTNWNNFRDETIQSFSSKKGRVPQILVEFLMDPKYRLYVTGDNNFIDALKANVEHEYTHYNICLGATNCQAELYYVGEFAGEKKTVGDKEEIAITTSMRPQHNAIKFRRGQHLHQDDESPITMLPNRQVVEYGNIVVDSDCGDITITSGQYVKLEGGENIVFLN